MNFLMNGQNLPFSFIMNFSASQLNYAAWAWIAFALLLLPLLLKKEAPYGRHVSNKWGITIPNKLGWIVMEIVSPLMLVFCFWQNNNHSSTFATALVFLWCLHYFNRSIVYPLRTKTDGKVMPLSVVLMAIFFNSVNASLNGFYLGKFCQTPEWTLVEVVRVAIGFAVFASGAFINIKSDNILLSLRKPGETGYKIPDGFLFRYISCPNLLGEMIEWSGFAMMAWNVPALSFAVWTIANLAPRALHHHQWYLKKFTHYPKNRKALIPFLV